MLLYLCNCFVGRKSKTFSWTTYISEEKCPAAPPRLFKNVSILLKRYKNEVLNVMSMIIDCHAHLPQIKSVISSHYLASFINFS